MFCCLTLVSQRGIMRYDVTECEPHSAEVNSKCPDFLPSSSRRETLLKIATSSFNGTEPADDVHHLPTPADEPTHLPVAP